MKIAIYDNNKTFMSLNCPQIEMVQCYQVIMHYSHMQWIPKFVKMGTHFWVKWGPNGDLFQQKWGPKKYIFRAASGVLNACFA